MRFTIIVTTILSLVLALIPHIVWVIGSLIARIWRCRLPYPPFGWTALGLVVLCFATIIYGYSIGRWQQRTVHIDYTSKDLPAAFAGYRIVHISDLHLSTFINKPEQLQRIVDSINAQKPDLICFTGDFVSISTDEALPFASILKQLRATDGVVSTLGNHDFFIYGNRTQEERQGCIDQLVGFERDTLGWNLLRNEHLTIRRGNDSITLLGVDNKNGSGQGFSTINQGDLPKAMEGTSGFRILLSHDPSHWEAEVLHHTDIHLTLSGHTHAAQVRFLGWTPASLMFRQAQGRYDENGQTLYITAGIGCTVPFRIGCPSEITVIELNQEKGAASDINR